jgi:LuxR family transcriptional regulator of csgAB operon
MEEHAAIEEKKEYGSQAGEDHLLTNREKKILEMVTAGYSDTKIAKELGISPHTAKTHIYNVCKKIKAPGRFQAALWTLKNL